MKCGVIPLPDSLCGGPSGGLSETGATSASAHATATPTPLSSAPSSSSASSSSAIACPPSPAATAMPPSARPSASDARLHVRIRDSILIQTNLFSDIPSQSSSFVYGSVLYKNQNNLTVKVLHGNTYRQYVVPFYQVLIPSSSCCYIYW